MTSGRYEIDVRPSTRVGLFRDRPCLSVRIWDRERSKYVALGERTRTRDPREAQALAAERIVEWENHMSEVAL